MTDRRPLTVGAATLAGLATAAGVALIVVSADGDLLMNGYLSEAGVPSASGSETYRAGVFAIALGLLLLAIAAVRQSRLASLLLATAAGLTTVSGAVSCSAGCPLPPYEQATTADLVHGGASILAVGVFALAVAALALWAGDRVLRTLSRIAFIVLAPLGIAIAVAMLAVGRSAVTSTLERVILLGATLWTLLASLVLAVRRT